MLLISACTPEKAIVSAPAPPQPIVDAPPYVCKLVSAQAFRLVSGASGSFGEETTGTEESGECQSPETTPRSLQVNWLQADGKTGKEHLDFLMKDRRRLYSRHGGVALPADLGDGLVAYVASAPFAEQPYRASSRFPCDGVDRLIDIYLPQVAKGRDAIKDLIDLMRIAQTRYGKLHNCTPSAKTDRAPHQPEDAAGNKISEKRDSPRR
ncbi:hypothetical protein AB0I81_59060 [Nonomuraea sp. NPDC050404]|uniref:hypothetical protein n=1 Tax=Nonomuraea sp. NPDC050404 TaxID=3155783 RepID=UPI0033FED4E9